MYCEAHIGGVSEIGVQKELTLEVSIQTDALLNNSKTFVLPEEESLVSKGQEMMQHDNDSEYNGTVRNNYLKVNSLAFSKQKK